MLPQDMAWNLFKKTGRIDAYLTYSNVDTDDKNVTDGVNSIEHKNKRTDSKTNQLW